MGGKSRRLETNRNIALMAQKNLHGKLEKRGHCRYIYKDFVDDDYVGQERKRPYKIIIKSAQETTA